MIDIGEVFNLDEGVLLVIQMDYEKAEGIFKTFPTAEDAHRWLQSTNPNQIPLPLVDP